MQGFFENIKDYNQQLMFISILIIINFLSGVYISSESIMNNITRDGVYLLLGKIMQGSLIIYSYFKMKNMKHIPLISLFLLTAGDIILAITRLNFSIFFIIYFYYSFLLFTKLRKEFKGEYKKILNIKSLFVFILGLNIFSIICESIFYIASTNISLEFYITSIVFLIEVIFFIYGIYKLITNKIGIKFLIAILLILNIKYIATFFEISSFNISNIFTIIFCIITNITIIQYILNRKINS